MLSPRARHNSRKGLGTWAGVSLAVFVFCVVYAVVGVWRPNRQWLAAERDVCEVLGARARGGTWVLKVRRKGSPVVLGSVAQVRRGRVGGLALYNGCDSFERCGRVALPCRIGRRGVRVLWRFPMGVAVMLGIATIVSGLSACFGALAFARVGGGAPGRPCHAQTCHAIPAELEDDWVDVEIGR